MEMFRTHVGWVMKISFYVLTVH